MGTTETSLARIEPIALVAIGGFAGANVRYATGLFLPPLAGTLAVNVVGSLFLGFLLYEAQFGGQLSAETRTVVATGFLSSLTTYSTFALESATASAPLLAANVVANYALGFSGVLVGRSLARRLAPEAVP